MATTLTTRALDSSKFVGALTDSYSTAEHNRSVSSPSVVEDVSTDNTESGLPPLRNLISVHDFEEVAQKFLSDKTFAFYSAASTDLVTQKENAQVWRSLLLRPRVLRNVGSAGTKRRILGCESDSPFFVCPAAMAKLAHIDGEMAIAQGCGAQNIIQTISSNASYSLRDIIKAGNPNQSFFFQLYVNTDRSKTIEVLQEARLLGVKAIMVTVDAPVAGKRESDERLGSGTNVCTTRAGLLGSDQEGGGLGRLMGKYIDPTLAWDDLKWLKEVAQLPIILKGIQTAADAKRALDYGVDAILLSNHGGRSVDTVQPAICTLLEIQKQCPELLDRMEVYVDGGITRGTDILKAIALGATAVGIARPFLYSVMYSRAGVERMIKILQDELVTAMKLCGITDVDQAHPGMVNTSRIESTIWASETHPWISWKPKAKL